MPVSLVIVVTHFFLYNSLFHFYEFFIGQLRQDLNNFWIKQNISLFLQIVEGFVGRGLFAVSAAAGQRVEHIHNSKNARLSGNILFCESNRVATPIPALMMITDYRQGLLQEWNSFNNACSDIRMDAHDLPLIRRQTTRFVQDRIANANLSNIVEQGASFQGFELLTA